jgi:extradiol dioxygenase family protein
MPITGINHINIEVSTEQLPKVRMFYEDVLGLKIGFRAKSKRDGAWLYAGNQPVIHLSVNDEPLTSNKTCFNHVAFACNGLAQCKRDLDIQGIEYMLEQRSLADKEMTQIFLYDPVGIKIELNFAGEVLS